MNDTNLILSLNNYGFNEQVLEDVRIFKETGKIPDHVKRKWRYKKKWNPFSVQNNHLFYQPRGLTVIIDADEKQEKMKEMYDDVKTGVGAGIVQFYHTICSKYINIQRKEVADFLKRQKTYQISRNTQHHINKPILASRPNERWAIDLIDMNRYSKKNKDYRYILTCIHHFKIKE